MKLKKGQKVKIIECYGGDKKHVGQTGKFLNMWLGGYLVDLGDYQCLAVKVEPIKNSKPKKAMPTKATTGKKKTVKKTLFNLKKGDVIRVFQTQSWQKRSVAIAERVKSKLHKKS